MEFKPAQCPSCGGSLQVPDDRLTVNCMYCGASVIVREAIQAAVQASIPNLLRLARTAALSGNHREAYDYFTKVLEYDSHNCEAWAGKAEAAGWQSGPNAFRIHEMINYFSNAIAGASEQAKENIKSRAALTICNVITHYYQSMRAALTPSFADANTWTTYLNKIGDLIKCIDQANILLPESKAVLLLGNFLIDDNFRPIPYLISGKRYVRSLPANWQSFMGQRRNSYNEKLWILDPSLKPATPVKRPATTSNVHVYLLIIGGGVLFLFVMIIIAALSSTPPKSPMSTNSQKFPAEVHVKRYSNTIDVQHDKIRIDAANIKFAKSSVLNEWFELEHTASCDSGATSPKAVVMTLTHETPSKGGWRFPSPISVRSISQPNASFTVTIKLQSGNAVFNQAQQLDLRKDLASDPTFYETFIADVSLDTLRKFGDQSATVIYELPGAQLTLTPKQSATLYAFAHAALRCGRE